MRRTKVSNERNKRADWTRNTCRNDNDSERVFTIEKLNGEDEYEQEQLMDEQMYSLNSNDGGDLICVWWMNEIKSM